MEISSSNPTSVGCLIRRPRFSASFVNLSLHDDGREEKSSSCASHDSAPSQGMSRIARRQRRDGAESEHQFLFMQLSVVDSGGDGIASAIELPLWKDSPF